MLAFASDRTSSHWKALETFDGSDRRFYKISNTCKGGASFLNLSHFSLKEFYSSPFLFFFFPFVYFSL